jgi:hypothetical protein
MTLLLLSILSLALGPILDRFASRKVSIVVFLEGFVAATILGLVLGHILPEAVEIGGWTCLPVAFVGLIGPQLLEKWTRESELRIHGTVATLALAGLFLHTLLDGAALSGTHGDAAASSALGVGVVLHRLPVGLTVWWLVRRSAGTITAVVSLIAICTGTLIGYRAGVAAISSLDTISVALFQAFVAGSLVHVVLHRSLTEADSSDYGRQSTKLGPFDWSGIGAVSGIVLLLLVPLSGHSAESQTGVAATFLTYWATSAPALITGYILLALIYRDHEAGITGTGKALYAIFTNWQTDLEVPPGLPPKVSRLIFSLSPILYLPALLLALAMLGIATSALLVSTAFAIAILLQLHPSGPTEGSSEEVHSHEEDPNGPNRLSSLEKAVERTAPWVLIGLLTAALLHVLLPPAWIGQIPQRIQVVGLAVVGSIVSVPALAGLPIALAYLSIGGSPGAAVSFVITGALLTPASLRVLKSNSGSMTTVLSAGIVIVTSILSGMVLNRLHWVQPADLPASTTTWQDTCAILLLILYTYLLLRVGPGRMVAVLGHGTHAHNH